MTATDHSHTEEPLPERLSREAEVLGALLEVSHRLHPDRLAEVVAREAAAFGLGDACIYVVDLDQRLLVPLRREGVPEREPLEVDATLAGRAFRTEQVLEGGVDDGDGGATVDATAPGESGRRRLWVPILDGAERLGVLAVTLDGRDEALERACRHVASVVGELIVSKSAYGDGLLMARRTREMDLAAELRWAMLPPLSFTGERVGIACVLEPAYEVAGDSFDYAVNDGLLHLAVMDAMGHGLEASRMANLATGAYRLARRRGLDILATHQLMDEAVQDQFVDEGFVTAQLATLDTHDGRLQWLNAGHPQPLLLRGGTGGPGAAVPGDASAWSRRPAVVAGHGEPRAR